MTDASDIPRGEFRESWRGTGVEDIEVNLSELGSQLHTIAIDVLETYNTQDDLSHESIEEIQICGSYVQNEAIKHVSDLDIRIVISTVPENHRELGEEIQRKYDATQNCFGYIDSQFHRKSLSDAQTIWIS